MPTVDLNEMDLRAFLTAFNAVAEVTGYTFDDETEYRLAIANLVGELRNQLAPATRAMITVTPRVPLAELLAEKYAAWDAACAGGTVCQSADSLIEESLEKSGFDRAQFAGGDGAESAIGKFSAAMTTDFAVVWNRYQLVICTSTREELAMLTLADMLTALLVVNDGLETGGSFWERWKKK